jgi:hypothetical protein
MYSPFYLVLYSILLIFHKSKIERITTSFTTPRVLNRHIENRLALENLRKLITKSKI